jgi:flagellin FlaB
VRTDNLEQENDTWGAIGIGAMIVFISLILVAAVASAVIIQTAEKLQQNAQTAGDDTSDELSGKLAIMQGFVNDDDDYVLYVRLAAGSDSIDATSVSWQLFCAAGYEDSGPGTPANAFGQANVQLQSVSQFGVGLATMTAQNAYKILIAANTCDAAAVAGAADNAAQLYLHIESGGTTFETLDVASADTGQAVI